MARLYADYASPVEQTTLTGLSTLPGGHVCVAGERILVYGDDDTNCGIWVVVDPGAWTRATDFDTSGEVVFDTEIVPDSSDGSNGVQAGSVFYVATTGTITPGTTAFSIVQRTYEEVQTPGVGITKVGSDWRQSTTGVLAGSYDRVTVDERGNVTTGSSSETATTFLEGLRLVWLTNTSFRVEEGAAYVTGTGSIVDLAVDTDITAGTKGLPGTFVANTWYYVYLYSNGGVGDIEVSTTAPAAPYRENAREHGSDDTRRFLGQVYATSTTVLRQFRHYPERSLMRYEVSFAVADATLAAGVTAFQTFNANTHVPPTSTLGKFGYHTTANGLEIGVPSSSAVLLYTRGDAGGEFDVLLESQQFRARQDAGGGASHTFRYYGYYFGR